MRFNYKVILLGVLAAYGYKQFTTPSDFQRREILLDAEGLRTRVYTKEIINQLQNDNKQLASYDQSYAEKVCKTFVNPAKCMEVFRNNFDEIRQQL